eukprot:1259838-Prymnesium_polylepis.1
MGKYATRVLRTAWLSSPVPMRGQPGLFNVQVPLAAIPDGWKVRDGTVTQGSSDDVSETDLVFEFEV